MGDAQPARLQRLYILSQRVANTPCIENIYSHYPPSIRLIAYQIENESLRFTFTSFYNMGSLRFHNLVTWFIFLTGSHCHLQVERTVHHSHQNVNVDPHIRMSFLLCPFWDNILSIFQSQNQWHLLKETSPDENIYV